MNPLLSLLNPEKSAAAPHLERVLPPAAMPGGEVEVHGVNLGPVQSQVQARVPHATVGDIAAPVVLSRASRVTLSIPEGSIAGDVVLHRDGVASNPLHLRVAVPMAENLHPVANPAVDAEGNVYATLSGARGQTVPVSIFQITRDFQMRPFVRDLLNPTGLAFSPKGYLYVSSRAEGTVYRVSPAGAVSTYAEGMGIATGMAFDGEGNLYVGDRSGTIFKIGRADAQGNSGEIFVHATLEPSMAAVPSGVQRRGDAVCDGADDQLEPVHPRDR